MNDQDDFDRTLRESLQGLAGGARHADLATGALLQAGRIKRRRRVTMGVGAAAVLVLAVPLAAQVIDQSTDQTASRPTKDDGSPSRPVDVAIAGLSQGAAPSVPYIDGPTLHSGDRDLPLPAGAGRVTDAIALPDGAGFWVLDPQTGNLAFDSTDQSLGLAPQADVTAPAVNSARHEAAWVAHTVDGLADFVTVDTSGGDAAVARLFSPQTGVHQVMGVSDNIVLANTTVAYSGRVGSGRYVVESALTDGEVSIRTTDLKYATAVNADLSRVVGRGRDMNAAAKACTAMYESPTYTSLWETCDWRPVEFSSDGSRLLAIPTSTDGLGPRDLAVLDADDGSILRTFTTEGTFGRSTFEGAESVDAVVAVGDQVAIVRCGIESGDCELATEPATVTPDDPDSLVSPYQLTAN